MKRARPTWIVKAESSAAGKLCLTFFNCRRCAAAPSQLFSLHSILVDKQGCQSFLDAIYQNGRKYTKLPLKYRMAIKYTKWHLYVPNGHINSNHFHVKALQNLPKLCFLVWKYTIWQPCRQDGNLSWSRSYDFWIYNHDAGVVVC
jgi:hypothetical protein